MASRLAAIEAFTQPNSFCIQKEGGGGGENVVGVGGKGEKDAGEDLVCIGVAESEPDVLEKEGCQQEGSDHVGDVFFGESAWTFPFILGLTSASPLDVTLAILLLLLNLGMQIMFAYVILGPSFMGAEFSEEIATAQRWRDGIAHDYKYMDLSQTSLATRVCSGDGALILSTVQATLVNQINSFMGFCVTVGNSFGFFYLNCSNASSQVLLGDMGTC